MKSIRKWIKINGQIKVVYVIETLPGYFRCGGIDLPEEVFFDTKIDCLKYVCKILKTKLADIEHQIKTYDKNER